MSFLVGEILGRAAATRPNQIALTLGERSVTFAEADAAANRAANGLRALGLSIGDRAVWWADMSMATADLVMGAARAGVAWCPIDPALSVQDAQAMTEYLRPRMLLADAAHAERAQQVASELDLPLAVVGATAGPVPGRNLDEIIATSSTAPIDGPDPSPSDVFGIFLTSGSTGKPKGVMMTQLIAWLRVSPGANRLFGDPPGAGVVNFWPMFHWAAWATIFDGWALRRPAHIVPTTDAPGILGTIDRWRPDTMYLIPALWQRVLESTEQYDCGSLRHAQTGTSVVTGDLVGAIKQRFPASDTSIYYGSSEAGRATVLPDVDLLRKPGSVGLPKPPYESRINEDGELCLRGETLFAGYFDLPDETASAVQDGWYHTGDLAEADDDGYLSITGRKREIIRSGGNTIAPVEVEAFLRHYPGVRELAIVGVPSTEWGEIVCAVVVPEPGSAVPSAEDLRLHIGDALSPFKHPRMVYSTDRLPRTPATGQVRRAELTRRIQTDQL